MKLAKNSKLVFIGDSITDCGRQRPVGEGLGDDPYGRGYVSLIRGLMSVDYSDYAIRVVNMGVRGNTVRDLKKRWDSDITALEPDWVSVMIGINDIWRQFDMPLNKDEHVYIDEYKSTLNELVEATVGKVSGIILMTPFFIETSKDDPMKKMADMYSKVVKECSDKYGTVFVDTQAAIDKLTKNMPTASISWDRVHPNIIGHMAVAKAFMEAVS